MSPAGTGLEWNRSAYIKDFLNNSVNGSVLFIAGLFLRGGGEAEFLTEHAELPNGRRSIICGSPQVRAATGCDELIANDQLFSDVSAHGDVDLAQDLCLVTGNLAVTGKEVGLLNNIKLALFVLTAPRLPPLETMVALYSLRASFVK